MASTTPLDVPPAPPETRSRPKSTGRAGDKVFLGLSRGSGILLLVIMASIAVFLSYRAYLALSVNEGNFFSTFDWNPAGDPPVFGIAVLLFGTVKSFLGYAASADGQKVLTDAGYAPIPESINAKVRETVAGLK